MHCAPAPTAPAAAAADAADAVSFVRPLVQECEEMCHPNTSRTQDMNF